MQPLQTLITPRNWRWVKKTADYVLLVVVVGAIGWSSTTAVATFHQATRNRAVVEVHLGTNPVRLPGLAASYFPAGTGLRTQPVAIVIANDSPDGVFIDSAELSGPYLTGAVKLSLPNNGYVGGGMFTSGSGTLTVDCAQTGELLKEIKAGAVDTDQAPTLLRISVRDANNQSHAFTLTVDTTADAIQGQVCAA